MHETKIKLEEVHPIEILGTNNMHLKIIQRAYPKLRIIARGSEIILLGDEEETGELATKIHIMVKHVMKYTSLDAEKLVEILGGDASLPLSMEEIELKEDGIIVIGKDGAQIKAKTQGQRDLVGAVTKNDLVFAVGPAGTGKTYVAVALAVRALKRKEVKRIIITRPAVEAGENLGFLPGDLKDKVDPYLRPIYDALNDMVAADKLKQFMEQMVIEVAPLAFMRGRTLNNAFVILDEAQNATHTQLKMFLTRMGPNAKFVITGDLTQIDLPKKNSSGLLNAIHILKDIEGVKIHELSVKDVIRHRIVRDIINAYEQFKKVD